MARTLLNPRRPVPMTWRRLSGYRDPSLRGDGNTNRTRALDCSETEIAVQKREEVPRVLTALIAAAQQAIEKSRPVIATVDEILAKHGNVRHKPRSCFLDAQEVFRAITKSHEACERVRSEFGELKAATWEAIAESRHLMAEIDAVIARR